MTTSSAEWDRRYAGSSLVWTAEPNRYVVEELSDLPAGRALDLACGEGRNAVWLAERGWRVTGADFSPVAVAKARARRAAWGCRRVGRGRCTGLRARDGRVRSGAGGLPAGAGRAAAAAGALAPGGVFLVVGRDLANLDGGVGGPQDPTVLSTPDSVVAELAGLRVDKAARVRRPVGDAVAIDTLVRATGYTLGGN